MANAEQLLQALNEPVFALDAKGLVTYATPSLTTWVQRDTGFLFADVLSDTDRTRFTQTMTRLLDGKTAAATIEINITTNDSSIPVELKLARGARDGNQVLSLVGWLRDISMEKSKESAANVQGSHLLDLVEHMSGACVVENAEGDVEMVNAAFCELFHIEAAPQSLVGITCAALFEQATPQTDKHIAPIYFPLDSTSEDEFEFAFVSGARGKQHSIPVAGAEGVAGRLHIFSTFEALSHTPVASATISAQSQMVERIARNLVSVLESAGSAIHRAEQIDLPSAVLDHFRRVEVSAEAAFAEVAGLLDFSQMDGGDLKLESAEFSLRESVAIMLDNVVPPAEERKVQLRVSVEQDVPELLTGDGARLMLVLRNLLECGLPSAQGGGEIALTVAPEYSADNQIHLSFRLEATPPKGGTRVKTMSPTSQMQFALARQIVRAMSPKGNGKIEVREKKETSIHQFTAKFPYRTEKEARTRPAFVTLTGMPVLIVSADAAQRNELAGYARSWRMHPREADNAAVALQLLTRLSDEESAIPLVITANNLPVQDGFLLAFRIKHHPRLKHTAIMMLTKSGKPGDAIACRENGISAYLRHPIATHQINEAIVAVMGISNDDVEATSTLITRHSLREAKAGSVLVIDPNREHAIVAVSTLKKKDYRVVHAETADEAFTELSQDVFDLIILDPMSRGFAELGIEGISDKFQERFANSPAAIPVLLAVEDDISAIEYGFAGMLKKPYDRDILLRHVATLIPLK